MGGWIEEEMDEESEKAEGCWQSGSRRLWRRKDARVHTVDSPVVDTRCTGSRALLDLGAADSPLFGPVNARCRLSAEVVKYSSTSSTC